MRIQLTRSVQNSHGRFNSGDVVDWPPHDAKPLVELGYAVDLAAEATFASAKARDMADEYDFDPEPGVGSGRAGAYTVADLRDILEEDG